MVNKKKMKAFINCNNINYKSIFKIKIKKLNDINNFSSMFEYCSSLLLLKNISKWNTNNVNYMNLIFYNCSSLKELTDIFNFIYIPIRNVRQIN